MEKAVKLFLRLAISVSFLSAVADRFGLWSENYSAWGNWDNFLKYTHKLNPWFSAGIIEFLAIVATAAEIILAVCLLIGFKTEIAARWSGILLLIFALAMTFSIGIKTPLDFSVFTASAAAFSLSLMKEKFLEVDILIYRKNKPNNIQ